MSKPPRKTTAAKAPATESSASDSPPLSQGERARALYEKLHGASAARSKPPAGGPPKPGYGVKSGANARNQIKGGAPPRRTQGKGG